MVFNEALMEKGINGKLYTQAANSPDMNLLDLGFFRVIQSFNDAAPKNKEELIQVVSVAYKSYLQNKINHAEKLQVSFYLDLLFSEIYDSLGSFVVFPKDCLFTRIFHSL